MAKNENQKLKLIYLMDMLYKETDEEHGVTIADIQSMLELHDIKAERKSLYNDIDTLIDYGMDIVKEKRNRNMYYKLVSRDFELAELKLLVDAVQSSKFITANKTNTLIKKIEGLASRYEAKKIHRQVYLMNRVKNLNEKIYISVDALHNAIYDNVQVEFQYTYWNEKKELVPRHDGQLYKVSPWGLVWDDENYYLVGYDEISRKIKHYRVDKIIKLTLTDRPRNGAQSFANFDAALYLRKSFGMYGGVECTVKLRVANHLAGVIIDRFGTDVMMIPDKENGFFTVNVVVAVSKQFLGWVIGLGEDVQIVGPDLVLSLMDEVIDDLVKKYKKEA